MSVGLLITGLGTFFFWGSSANWNSEDYATVLELNPIQAKVSQKDTFSILTYNIGYLSGMTNNTAKNRPEELFTDNLAKTISLLQEIQPDIVAFQEIDLQSNRSYFHDQVRDIGESSGFHQAALGVNWDKRYIPFPYWPISMHFGQMVSGQAVLSKFPIIENHIDTLSKPENNPFYYNAFYIERLAQTVKIQVGERDLFIINVHLEAFDAATRDRQIEEVLKIYQYYASNSPVILCGDFNSTLPNASFPYQDDHVLESLLTQPHLQMAISMEENAKNESRYFTFNSVSPDRRIDYFFFNPEFIQFVEAEVMHDAGQISDHLPVRMVFAFK